MRVRSQKLIHWSKKHTKKTKFTKKFFERASLKSGIPEMCHLKSRILEMGQLNSGIPELSYLKLRIPEMSQLNSGIPEMCYLIWAGSFREFLIWGGSFREFLIWGGSFQEFLNWAGSFREFLIWGGSFREFLIWGWPSYENFLENCVFLACFGLQWISFWLLTLIYSDGMYILQKNWSKTLNPAWNKGSNILLPHIWSSHRLLCSMTKLREHSREIC